MLIPLPAPSARFDFSPHCPVTATCPWLHSGWQHLTQHLKEPRDKSSLQPAEPFICPCNPLLVPLYKAGSSVYPSLPYFPPLQIPWGCSWLSAGDTPAVRSRSPPILYLPPRPSPWQAPKTKIHKTCWLGNFLGLTLFYTSFYSLSWHSAALSILDSKRLFYWKCLPCCEHWKIKSLAD